MSTEIKYVLFRGGPKDGQKSPTKKSPLLEWIEDTTATGRTPHWYRKTSEQVGDALVYVHDGEEPPSGR